MNIIKFGINVEWDDEKNILNIKKHGISFDTAALVFADEDRIEYYDRLHSIDEDRYITIGHIGEVVFVVYTIRNDNIRMISARLATKRERDIYYGY